MRGKAFFVSIAILTVFLWRINMNLILCFIGWGAFVMLYPIIVLVSIIGALIQGVTGFGSSLTIMTILPYFMALPQAVAISCVIPMAQMAALVWIYRQAINWRRVLFPSLFYLIGCWLSIRHTLSFDPTTLKFVFGIFLIIIGIYFLRFSEKAKVKDTIPIMVGCSFVSGLINGLFGIGGPLMVLYYMAACDSMNEYIANLQCCFLITDIYCLILRTQEGIFTADLIGPSIVGIVVVLIGQFFAARIVARINSEDIIRHCTYVMVCVSGVIMGLTNLPF